MGTYGFVVWAWVDAPPEAVAESESAAVVAAAVVGVLGDEAVAAGLPAEVAAGDVRLAVSVGVAVVAEVAQALVLAPD